MGTGAVVTNMPFGIRVGDHRQNTTLYKDFFSLLPNLLKPQGLLVLYTQEITLSKDLFDKTAGIKLLEIHRFEVGGLKPAVFIARRT